jgi:uncharacterized protein YhaN
VFEGEGIPPGALHVVYGANEAGKSTALRAVSGLLFGIPAQTRDAHVHRMGDLRVGAVLEGTDGTVLEVVRRKGNKNTLLDAQGNVLDDGLLRRLCGAATEATFRALFGLDHVSLREGAQALLEGKGNVGESLFDAALGQGRGIHRVLEELETEADELFTPQAQKRKLNEAIRAYQEARAAVRLQARSGEGWLKQTEGLAQARDERERLAALVRERKRELYRQERSRRLLPIAARHRHLLGRIAELGDVVLLPPNAAKAREAALQDRRQAEEEVARLDADIAEQTARRERLSVPPWLDNPAVTGLADLPSQVGAYRKAAQDRPRLAATLAAREAEAEELAGELRGGAPAPVGGGTPMATLGVAEQTRIRTLSLSETALVQAQLRAARARDEQARRWGARRDELEALPPNPQEGEGGGAEALRSLLARVQQEGDLEPRRQVAERERQRLAAELEQRLAALRLHGTAADRIVALAVPAPESVERFAGEAQALDARSERISDESAELNRRVRAVERKLSALTSSGQVPSLQTLADARGERTDAWARLRGAWEGSDAASTWPELAARFEGALGRADGAADRLLAESDRVASASALEAESQEITRLARDTEAQQAEVARRRAEASVSWRALWAPAGVEAGGPQEMRGWLRGFGEAAEVARRLERTASEVAAFDEQIQTVRAEMVFALRAAGAVDKEASPGRAPALRLLCERVAAVAQSREERARRRADLGREVAALEEDLAVARREHDVAEEALAAWRIEWTAALLPLGLRAEASAAEAMAVLDVAGALARKQEEVADLRRRILSIDRDAARLEESVRGLVGALAPELADRPFDEAALEITRRHQDGMQAASERAELEEDLRRRCEAHRVAQLACATAEDGLGELMRKAAVASVSALEEAELRSAEALELRRQRGESEDQILAGADGLTMDKALAEVSDAGAEEIDERIATAREELDELEAQNQRAHQSIGSLQEGLRVLEEPGTATAAEAAGEAQGHLARIRAMTEQYLRLRIAARLLAGEIERYREQHQGPVLLRAGALLARLTLGRYTGLRADVDDTDSPVLRCLRTDGGKVGVEGLSDGARDQLFLALRLATLEHQATAVPLPLILDDILIHFDDDRAAAALGVLAEHAATTQVMLFTHHARIVDLAQRALPASSLRVLNLDG